MKEWISIDNKIFILAANEGAYIREEDTVDFGGGVTKRMKDEFFVGKLRKD